LYLKVKFGHLYLIVTYSIPKIYILEGYIVILLPIRGLKDKKNKDSIYLNYKEKKLYIYNKGVSNKGGV